MFKKKKKLYCEVGDPQDQVFRFSEPKKKISKQNVIKETEQEIKSLAQKGDFFGVDIKFISMGKNNIKPCYIDTLIGVANFYKQRQDVQKQFECLEIAERYCKHCTNNKQYFVHSKLQLFWQERKKCWQNKAENYLEQNEYLDQNNAKYLKYQMRSEEAENKEIKYRNLCGAIEKKIIASSQPADEKTPLTAKTKNQDGKKTKCCCC